MSGVKIRYMDRQDWPDVAGIYQAGMDTNLATFETECPSWDEWDRVRAKECRLVAVLGDRVVGWASIMPTSERCVYAGVCEVSVYVSPGAKGKGVGTALLTKLCGVAQREGYWTLTSSIMENNEASISLHKKCGFRVVGYRERIGKDAAGEWRNTVLMELRNSVK